MSDDPNDPRLPFDFDDPNSPDEDARWQRPADRPQPPPDRFPALPEEAPRTVPLREPPRRRAPSGSRSTVADAETRARDRGRNGIALFFLLASCGVIAYVALIWQNPYSAINPLAPPTPLPQVITATYTPTLTYTPSPTLTPRPTLTPSPIPTDAPTLTFTPIFLEGFSTPQGTPPGTEEAGSFRFALQSGRILYITNPAGRGGCNWSSIAGSVMNYDGSALNGYSVHIVGDDVDETVTTGSAPGMGPGGFELALGNIARSAQYVAQLIDPSGAAVSPVYTVETNADCDYNIAALRFVETEPNT